MNSITSKKGKMEPLGSHMTHMAEMIGTIPNYLDYPNIPNFSGYPNLYKVLSIHTPDGPEPLEFSFQLRKKAELLCKEQKQRQSWRCFLSAAAVGEHLTGLLRIFLKGNVKALLSLMPEWEL